MAVREIKKFKDPILKQKCQPVTIFDEKLRLLTMDMRDTMLHGNGIGLAAPQIGEPIAVIVVKKQSQKGTYIVVNPEIVKQSIYTNLATEGCLSYPGMAAKIRRPNSVTVKGQTVQGGNVQLTAVGLEARIFCHEIDHLHGDCKVAKGKVVKG